MQAPVVRPVSDPVSLLLTLPLPPSPPQEKDTIRLKREAKTNGGFYVEPEAKLAFVMRIRGLNKIHPKVCLYPVFRWGVCA